MENGKRILHNIGVILYDIFVFICLFCTALTIYSFASYEIAKHNSTKKVIPASTLEKRAEVRKENII